jgi:hypothetical protein
MKQLKVTPMQVALPCHRCGAPTREKGRLTVGRTGRHVEAPLCGACQLRVPNVRIIREQER